jgi:hypothetical protein
MNAFRMLENSRRKDGMVKLGIRRHQEERKEMARN